MRKPNREAPKRSYDWMVMDRREYGSEWNGCERLEDCRESDRVKVDSQFCGKRLVKVIASDEFVCGEESAHREWIKTEDGFLAQAVGQSNRDVVIGMVEG